MRLSIATKIFIAFAAVIIVFTVVLMFGIYRTQVTYAQIRAVNQTVVPLSLLLSDVQTDLKSFSLVLNERDPLVLRRTLQVTRLGPSMPERFRSKMQRAENLAAAPSDLGPEQVTIEEARREILSIREQIDGFAERSRAFADVVLKDDTPLDDSVTTQQTTLRDEAREIDERLSGLRGNLQRAADRGLARANEIERSSLYALSGSALAALVVAIALLVAVLLTIRRLTALTDATARIGEGDYRPMEEPARGGFARDEIDELRGEFNAMAERLKERDEELRAQHAQLLRSERLATIGRMTSLITHELRNPLSSINLNSEMLLESLTEAGVAGGEDDEEVTGVLETIIAEVDRLRDITEEYLVYARLPSPKFEDENLSDVLQQLVDFHSTEWLGDQVEVSLQLPTADVRVHVDPNQVRQAVLNLVRNAVEASSEGGVVAIRALINGSAALIEVEDSGAGMSAETQAHLFEPFYTTKSSGTGLGLAMTQQIVEEHGGSIQVESAANQGTTFRIELPLVDG